MTERKPEPKPYPIFLTLGQAAKRVGKSKATISNAIKTGRLSVHERSEAGFKIDTAELFRVFAPNSESNVQIEQSERPSLDTLTAKLEAAERLLTDRDQTITDLRKRLDQFTLLLTGPPAPAKKSFWKRWFS